MQSLISLKITKAESAIFFVKIRSVFSNTLICRLFPLFIFILSFGNVFSQTATGTRWWSDATESSLSLSGANRQELVLALEKVPAINEKVFSSLLRICHPGI